MTEDRLEKLRATTREWLDTSSELDRTEAAIRRLEADRNNSLTHKKDLENELGGFVGRTEPKRLVLIDNTAVIITYRKDISPSVEEIEPA